MEAFLKRHLTMTVIFVIGDFVYYYFLFENELKKKKPKKLNQYYFD